MSLELYNASQSTCSQKARICLAEKGLDFIDHQVDLWKGEQLTPEYQALNPNGVVPTLVVDGEPIIDSSVIIEYLDEAYPETALSPAEPRARAHMREWMRFIEEVPTPAVRVPSFNKVFVRHYQSLSEEEFMEIANLKPLRKDFFIKMGRTGYSDQEMEQALGRISMTVERMDEVLANQPWLMGEQFTLADICVLPTFVRMNDIGYGDLWRDAKGFSDWFNRIRERPSYKAAFYFGSLLTEQYPDIKEQLAHG